MEMCKAFVYRDIYSAKDIEGDSIRILLGSSDWLPVADADQNVVSLTYYRISYYWHNKNTIKI